jgi:cysteinyl-tRNA synthetase
VLDRYDPMAVRYSLMATHYRMPLQLQIDDYSPLTIRGIEDARSALARLRRALGDEPLALEGDLYEPSVDAFKAAMDSDFNTPDALAVIFDLAREINTRRAAGEDFDAQRRTLVTLLDVLGLDLRSEAPRDGVDIGPYVELLLDVRKKLRVLKQWELADDIRKGLGALGVTVEDRPGGESNWRLEAT